MKRETQEAILECWDLAEANQPDKSTEYLMAITVDLCWMMKKIDVDNGHISAVLAERQKEREH